MTITEMGYCQTPKGELDAAHPMMHADIRGEWPPVSALGFLYAAATQRMKAHGARFTVLSCDNLVSNGHLTRRVLLQLARAS